MINCMIITMPELVASVDGRTLISLGSDHVKFDVFKTDVTENIKHEEIGELKSELRKVD